MKTKVDQDLINLVLAVYLGEVCQGCKKSFDTIESLKSSVWWPWEKGRIGHKTCYEKVNKYAP